jgi:hypothetical protein
LNWNAFAAVLEGLSAPAGRDAGGLRAAINRELRVFCAKAAGDAWDEDFGVGFDQDGHDKIYDFRFSIYYFNSKQFFLLRLSFFDGAKQPDGFQIFFAPSGGFCSDERIQIQHSKFTEGHAVRNGLLQNFLIIADARDFAQAIQFS